MAQQGVRGRARAPLRTADRVPDPHHQERFDVTENFKFFLVFGVKAILSSAIIWKDEKERGRGSLRAAARCRSGVLISKTPRPFLPMPAFLL
jgi:hypothetical protein